MKRIYCKPDIIFDSFQMSTDIGVCTTKTGPNVDQCGLDFGYGITVFAEAPGIASTACNFDVGINVDEEEWNGLCFHAPLGGETLFTSG